MKLFILPHAGSSAYAYVPLKRALDARFDVVCQDLPGHGRRAREAPLGTVDAVVNDLIVSMAPPQNEPWALFGHSMGALLGHALIHALGDRGRRRPIVLFASGAVAPFARPRKFISHLPRELFWQEVSRYGGVPKEILQSEEYKDYFEGLLRRDFAVVENYAAPAPKPMPVPVVAFYGRDEMSALEAASWEQETTKGAELFGFPGHHFFVFDHVAEIAAQIARTLGGGAPDGAAA